MRRLRFRESVFVLVWAVFALGAGYGPYPAYQGAKFPATAAGFATLPTSAFDDGRPVILSYFLDTTGDRRADVALATSFDAAAFGVKALLGAYVSPSNPDVIYALAVPSGGGPYEVQTYRRSESDGWERIAASPLPPDIYTLRGGTDSPASRTFEAGYVHLIALRRVEGGDWILAVGTRAQRGGASFVSRFAIYRDGPDDDPFANLWSASVEIPNTEAVTLDDRGRVLARRIVSTAQPFNTSGFLRVVDTNGDRLPDAADEQSFSAVSGSAFGSYGIGDVDLGGDRLIAGPYATVDLDSYHRPIAGSERDIPGPCSSGCGLAYIPFQIWAGRGGYPLAFAHNSPNQPVDQQDVLAILDDLDFNRHSSDYHSSNPLEVRELVRDSDLPDPMMRAGSVAELTELAFSGAWSGNLFREFGVFPGDEAFTFRMGSQDFDQFSISKNGIVSFVGPVAAASTMSGLESLHGVIAPAWSDSWDTSKVRVFAGYAPANTSFIDGSRVLAFTIEWRGLRVPGWDPDRFVSVRLVMFSDGSFRTDFGALEASELGSHPFVVGYAGPGNVEPSGTIDLTNHSWGGAPVGTRSERVAGQAFGSSNRSDLGHVWVRWSGYPDRLDAATPPQILDVRLVDGRKITMTATGSDIQAGARLVVDGVEAFDLKLNGAGRKWVVKPKARSTPGNRSVHDIWGDGLSHRIVVINPDGIQSTSTSPK